MHGYEPQQFVTSDSSSLANDSIDVILRVMNIRRDLLLSLVKTAGSATARMAPIPILSSVLIRSDGNLLTVAGTDTQSQILVSAPADSQETCCLAINAKKLVDILSGLPQGCDVRLEIKGATVVVRAGRSRFVLQSQSGDAFPLMTDSLDGSVQVGQDDFTRLLKSVSHAMATNDVRYYLNGAHFVLAKGFLRAVATNGYRLATAEIPSQLSGAKDDATSFTVPARTITELLKAFPATDDGKIRIAYGQQCIRITIGHIEITSKTIVGRYPDWARVIPNRASKPIPIPVRDVAEALSRARLVCEQKNRGVRFAATSGVLQLAAHNSSQEDAVEEVSLPPETPNISGGWNVDYLLDAFLAPGAEEVSIYCAGEGAPMLIESPRLAFQAVVMSMRI